MEISSPILEKTRLLPVLRDTAAGWLGLLPGFLAFFVVTGGVIANPTNVAWLLASADPASHFFGWHLFRQSPPWQFPLGANPAYGAGLDNSIVFSDSIPLLALLFKPFDRLLPPLFQYTGLWILLCFVLQSWFAYRLLRGYTKDLGLSLIGSAFFVLAPVWLFRLSAHYALSGQWLLLAGLGLYFRPRFSAGRWSAVLAVAALVHSYLLVMGGAIWVTDLWQRCWKGEIAARRAARAVLEGVVITVAVMGLAGYFVVGGGAAAEGFGYFRMNLLAPADPKADPAPMETWSSLMGDWPNGPGDYEGFGYLGSGMLVLGLLAGYQALRRPRFPTDRRTVVPLLVLASGLFLYAVSNRIALGGWEILAYDLPPFLQPLVGAFRSSGRMFWPVYYLLYLGIFYVLWNRLERRTATLLSAGLLVFQLVDSWAGVKYLRTRFLHPEVPPSPLRSPLWAELGQHYRHLVYVFPSNAPDRFLPWARFAADNRMTMNFGYFSRVSQEKLERARADLLAATLTQRWDPQSLYVYENQALWRVAVAQAGPADGAGILDGVPIFAPGLKHCPVCDPRAMADLQPVDRRQIEYRLGNAIAFTAGGTGQGYTVSGWSAPEPGGTWSDGAASVLAMRLADPEARDLTLRIEGDVFVNQKHPHLTLGISVNGRELKQLAYRAPQGRVAETLTLPGALVAAGKGVLVIRFTYRAPASPQVLGLGDDDRWLGLKLVSLRLD